MLVKINIKVLPKHYQGTFYVKLLEVDSYRDDLLGVKVESLQGNAMGFLRDRSVPEAVDFEFFISGLQLAETTAELKAQVYSDSHDVLGETEVTEFPMLQAFRDGAQSFTLDLKPVVI